MRRHTTFVALAVGALLPPAVHGQCPFLGKSAKQHPSRPLPKNHPPIMNAKERKQEETDAYAAALAALDFSAVKEDLKALFVNSQESWPADYGNYAPFFVRLAWHCSGSYRTSDGRGGCDGGRQRFEPEQSWDDNTNLDKARGLLWPIKEKYGLGLSWGDLFILAGTTAIESMGGPVLGFCGGRIDDPDGSESTLLGPTEEQEELMPCDPNGNCTTPLGTTTVGLIYVNPEGPFGDHTKTAEEAEEIRDTFARMAMNDSETVALIGGGHSFGKAHGACSCGNETSGSCAGPSPAEDPSDPWPGLCPPSGKGEAAWTSGFEGPWTTTPTQWAGNEYFKLLLAHDWEAHQGASGHWQWRVANGTSPVAPAAGGGSGDTQDIMMMTSDVSLLHDPTGRYRALVEHFSRDLPAFENAFKHAWYKLTSRDMGPAARCVGDDVPPPQPFQYPLPPAPPAPLAYNVSAAAAAVAAALTAPQPDVLPPDEYPDTGEGGVSGPWYGALMVRLAWSCASTFRQTDYLGGCDGARIRSPYPESEWPANAALQQALELLEPVKDAFGEALSWADLIVLAGSVGLKSAGVAQPITFCGGRTDAPTTAAGDDGDGDGGGDKNYRGDGGSDYLESPVLTGDFSPDVTSGLTLRAFAANLGLSDRELVALLGGGHSIGQMHADRSGFTGSWSRHPTHFGAEYFTNLLEEEWREYGNGNENGNENGNGNGNGKGHGEGGGDDNGIDHTQYTNADESLFMLKADLEVLWDPSLKAIAQEYASSDPERLATDFAAAWSRLVDLDRFEPPPEGACVFL